MIPEIRTGDRVTVTKAVPEGYARFAGQTGIVLDVSDDGEVLVDVWDSDACDYLEVPFREEHLCPAGVPDPKSVEQGQLRLELFRQLANAAATAAGVADWDADTLDKMCDAIGKEYDESDYTVIVTKKEGR